jgi:HAD superfamily hydrolase (TIGR01662 family)
MIQWVFFDVGNVLMNDDPVMAFLYVELHRAMSDHGHSISFADLLVEREQVIRSQGPGHWYVLGERYLGLDGLHALMHHCAGRIRADYMAYHNLLPGMEQAIRELAEDFSLGILANQLREVREALEAVGLRQYFRILAISELIDLKKPDPAMFRWALEQAGCAADEAIMVGDRIDNDIAPARALGLHTIWFHPPLKEKGYTPAEGEPRLYFESQQRASIGSIRPSGPHERPDAEATSSRELLIAVRRLREASRGLPASSA